MGHKTLAGQTTYSRGSPLNTLKENQALVFFAELDQQPQERREQLASYLTSEEKTRAQRFHHQQDSERFIIHRGLLRETLASFIEENPCQLSFRQNEHGKPYLSQELPQILFNLSHSENMMALALTKEAEVGIDIEKEKKIEKMADLVKRFFSPAEQEEFASLPIDQQQEAFYLAWTRKEAFVKAAGRGLALGLDTFDVNLNPKQKAKLLAIRSPGTTKYPLEPTHLQTPSAISQRTGNC